MAGEVVVESGIMGLGEVSANRAITVTLDGVTLPARCPSNDLNFPLPTIEALKYSQIGAASAMAYPNKTEYVETKSPLQLTLVILALSALFILYGYLLWTRPLAKYRTASKIRTYLQSKEETPFYSTSAAYSTQRAVNTFAHFQELSEDIIDSHWGSYRKLSPRQKTLGEAIGYPAKLRDMEAGNKVNSSFARKVARFAERETGVGALSSKDSDVYRGREALKHLVRDWSDEGQDERKATQTPILEALDELFPTEKRADARVLVPGCGLGRLAWEISRLGMWSRLVYWQEHVDNLTRL